MTKTFFHKYYIHLILTSLLTTASAKAEPIVTNVSGGIATGSVLTIQGSGFTKKPNIKPLFWWRADMGTTPSSLGRKTIWDTMFKGDISSLIVAPGSQQSIGFDHGTVGGAALGAVEFNSDKVYLHRKTYEDFDVKKAIAIRSRYTDLTGTINIGDIVTGSTSGATGIVSGYNDSWSEIYYSTEGGTINANPEVLFLRGEIMTTPTATMTNNEGKGALKSFNFKTIRFWSTLGANNIHLNSQGADNSPAFRITPERTDGTTWSGNFTKKALFPTPNAWKTEEVEYKTSSIDISDGIWNFYQNGVLGTDNTFMHRSSTWPDRYAIIYQSQVSNGAQPGSIMYYDSLYIDDTWHRVVLCKGKTWATCGGTEIQIPTEWIDTKIIVNTNLGGFNPNSVLFLYVVDQEGIANSDGYPLCPKCPLPPPL